jgi:hypothetical protein
MVPIVNLKYDLVTSDDDLPIYVTVRYVLDT